MVFTCNNDELVYDVIKKIRDNKFCNLLTIFGKFLLEKFVVDNCEVNICRESIVVFY